MRRLSYDQVGRSALLNGRCSISRRANSACSSSSRAGRLVSKDQLVDHLCGWGEEVSHNAIEVYVHRLRKKLEPGGCVSPPCAGWDTALKSRRKRGRLTVSGPFSARSALDARPPCFCLALSIAVTHYFALGGGHLPLRSGAARGVNAIARQVKFVRGRPLINLRRRCARYCVLTRSMKSISMSSTAKGSSWRAMSSCRLPATYQADELGEVYS